jgi:hypothetical protein
MTFRQTFSNPRKMIRYTNIVFLTGILLFIGDIIVGLINGTKDTSSLGGSGLLFVVIINSWVLSLRPFVEKIKKEKIKKKY